MSTASVADAIEQACQGLRRRVAELAGAADWGGSAEDVDFSDLAHGLRVGGKPVSLAELLEKSDLSNLRELGRSTLTYGFAGGAETDRSFYSFGAVFAEVRVDPDLGTVEVSRMVGVFDAGRVINPKTARSQIVGGMTFGIGMALMEETIVDRRTGRIVNPNLGEYHIPVNADVHDLEVEFLDVPDDAFNAFGARGIGEIGNVGASAAIANAVSSATGVRVWHLPIRLDAWRGGS